MNHRALVAVAVGLIVAPAAGAQIIDSRRISREPAGWTSLAVGWLTQQGLCDQESNACWDFGGAPQWRGTLEYPLGRGATVGAAATFARVPLTYNGGLPGASCGGCDANANIAQYFGNFRLGSSGIGIHQVIDVNAGMTVFSNFRSTNGARLGTGRAVSDFSFGIGYGFGYGFSPRMQFLLVQDYALVIHRRVSGNANNTAQQSTTRIGLRVGLGEKRLGL